MSVLVGTGDAKVNYNAYAYSVYNDAASTVPISTADPSNPRIDRIVAYVDRSEPVQDIVPNNPGITKTMAVTGTPAGSPTRPSDGTVDSAVGAGNPWFDLADVLVGTGVTTISNGNITDRRNFITPQIRDGSIDTQAIDDGAVTPDKTSFTTYSTSPVAIGKWTDGKIIYRKVVVLGSGPNNTSKSVAHGISNLDRVIRLYGGTGGIGKRFFQLEQVV
jgi:hypothetical protein